MYPSVKREIPDFIAQYLIFCDCLIDIYKQKTCLAFTRNLKFFEFHQKQLMSCIDLSGTCLNKVKQAIQTYKGPKGNWYDSSSTDGDDNNGAARSLDSSSISAITGTGNSSALEICFGKYVFQSFNIMKIYIIVQCWDKCVILHRLPNFKGFEVKAQYEDFQCFRVTHGQIKYCPILEIQLLRTTIKTDLEDNDGGTTNLDNFAIKKSEIKQLLDRARSAKTELQLHKTITSHSFERLQNRFNYGLPGDRSIKLEEKQMLARCGDIWKRFTSNNDLVIGIPLVNQCGPPNLTILHNIRLLVQPNPCPQTSIKLVHRLFQLKQSFEQLDSIQTFLQTEDEQLQANVYVDDTKCQLLPESYAILLVKFKLSQIINLSQCPLLLSYEVHRGHNSSVDITPLQIFLQVIDFYEILYGQRAKYELSFQTESLHQDLLTTAMVSQDISVKIIFGSYMDVEIFENCLIQKFEFEKHSTFNENTLHSTVFYNQCRSSLWFGSLVLRFNETEENENGHCSSLWKIYCPEGEKLGLFIKILLNDLIALECNVIDIENNKKAFSDKQWIAEFENALRLELCSLKQLVSECKSNRNSMKWFKLFTKFCKDQLKSDEIMKTIKKHEIT